MDDAQFKKILSMDKETEHLEFKEAKTSFNLITGTRSLCGYFTALANEGGGRLIFGIKDKLPREVCGTSVNIAKLKKVLL